MTRIVEFLLLLSLVTAVAYGTTHAATDNVVLVPRADGYGDMLAPTQDFNGQNLHYRLDWLPEPGDGETLYCPHITRLTLLRFDLSPVDFEIARARLALVPMTGSAAVHPGLQLASLEDNWEERAVTWNTLPAPEAPFLFFVEAELDQGYAVWDDRGDPAAGLAAWLAAQQAGSGGDDLATLTLLSAVPTACYTLPPDEGASIQFFDRESGFRPRLFVADVDHHLPPLQPLRVRPGMP